MKWGMDNLFNVRMRAAKGGAHEEGGRHISGGELITTHEELRKQIHRLVDKAFAHSRGMPDFFQVKVEVIESPLSFVPPLSPIHYVVPSVLKGRLLAKKRLATCGINDLVIEKAFQLLEEHSHVRGALIIDAKTGERLDKNFDRGVRVSAFSWKEQSYEEWLSRHRLTKQERMKDAVALASKVCAHPWTVAEVCWSDDPDYVTGYVASSTFGYERISHMKKRGDERGGRLLFVENYDETYLRYLEEKPVWIGWEELG